MKLSIKTTGRNFRIVAPILHAPTSCLVGIPLHALRKKKLALLFFCQFCLQCFHIGAKLCKEMVLLYSIPTLVDRRPLGKVRLSKYHSIFALSLLCIEAIYLRISRRALCQTSVIECNIVTVAWWAFMNLSQGYEHGGAKHFFPHKCTEHLYGNAHALFALLGSKLWDLFSTLSVCSVWGVY